MDVSILLFHISGVETMQTKNVIEIVPLCHRSAPCCLGLAERTFGKDSPEYKAVQNFNAERRAGFLVHIRRCVVGFIVVDNRHLEHTKILSMAVCPSERRTGIGREMLRRLIRYGKRKTLTIRVNVDSIEAHEFLRGQGFNVVAIEMKSPQRKYVFQKVMDISTVSIKDVTQPHCSGDHRYETIR
jgi:GNAT superfamily N-acetyltransferase